MNPRSARGPTPGGDAAVPAEVAPVTERSIVVLMPMRNEIATIATTLRGLVRQTLRPELVLVLSDGATDGSNDVVRRFAEEHPWIELVELPDRGFDLVGKGVAQVLNYGLDRIRERGSNYVAKVDADLDLPPDYFARLVALLEADAKAGVAAGHPFTFEAGARILERHGDNFPSGTARLYRRSALEQIAPFPSSVGWDTVDLLRLWMRGWISRTLHELEFHHMRRMGTRNGYIDGMIRDGRNAYLTGYGPVVFLARALFNARFRPYLLRTICMVWGYGKAMAQRLERVVSEEERRFHGRILRRRLLGRQHLS